MNNLLRFIQKNSNFLVFILLEVVAFILIVSNNEYPKSKTLSTANSIIAKNYETISNIQEYFSLSNSNQSLVEENIALRNQLRKYENLFADSIEQQQISLHADMAQYYMPAKVVQMTNRGQVNYLTINKGQQDGIEKGMGVCNSEGVVGIVCTVGKYYSIVIPIIHNKANISSRIKRNDYIGTVNWDGKDKRYAYLTEIASHIDLEKGDTVISSGLTSAFPEGIPIGVIEDFEITNGSTYYTIRIKIFADYQKIKNVYVIGDMLAKERMSMENEQN